MTKGKKKVKKNKIVLIESTCPHCEFKWQRKLGLKRVQCPACKKSNRKKITAKQKKKPDLFRRENIKYLEID